MREEQVDSEKIEHALSLLESIKNSPLSDDEIYQNAVQLAGYIVDEGSLVAKTLDKKDTSTFSRMAKDANAKALSAAILDQTFRPTSEKRMANQLAHLLFQYGIPKTFPFVKRLLFNFFKIFGCRCHKFFVPIFRKSIKKALNYMIKPSSGSVLNSYLEEKEQDKIKTIPFIVGDRALSEYEVQRKLHAYLDLIKNKHIHALSIKTSHLCSHFTLFNWEDSEKRTLSKLREIFRAAKKTKKHPRDVFITICMENYPTFYFNIELFKKLLEEEEFHSFRAGITLQAYFPESFTIQKELTKWAQDRVKKGHASITITIVKGSYLGLESLVASQNSWNQAAFLSKVETDANFKRMIRYGLEKERLNACEIIVGTHNVFDISYALVLLHSKNIDHHVFFAMLEGRAIYNRKVFQRIIPKKLIIAPPLVSPSRPSEAVTYYLQRINDGANVDNFLYHAYLLDSESRGFAHLAELFAQSLEEIPSLPETTRRTLNRDKYPERSGPYRFFENEANTDFTCKENRKWGAQIIKKWKNLSDTTIPLVIDGKEEFSSTTTSTHDFTDPSKPLYHYSLAKEEEIDHAFGSAENFQKEWKELSFHERLAKVKKVATIYREQRADFVGVLMADGAKNLVEADDEVSEAIDTIEYYRLRMEKLLSMKDISWSPRGISLVISSRGFPCTIPTGGIFANLLCGNTVIFKPAPESVLTGWHLVNAFWKAGIPKEAIQFLPCSDELVEKKLITDSRLAYMFFGGKTQTAKRFIEQAPHLPIEAATDGKNCMIISDAADLHQAASDLLESAFSYSGQKKSSASLGILLEDVYNNPEFIRLLKEATLSFPTGSVWDNSVKIVPLIQKPDEEVFHALTTLDEGEEWIVKPQQDANNPHLWTPGIKKGVKVGSFAHTHIVPAPLLCLMKAKDFQEALDIANSSPYGLTAGIHTLDRREQVLWEKSIEAGNLYINRNMTHAIIRRHPYGGSKESSFGRGFKAGGPNYLTICMKANQRQLPREKLPVTEKVNSLTSFIEEIDLTAEELGIWYASVANYAYWWKRMKHKRDPSKLVGEDNFYGYLPRKKIVLRVTKDSSPLEVLRVCAAALTCEAELTISWCKQVNAQLNWQKLSPFLSVIAEPEKTFLEKVEEKKYHKIRLVDNPSNDLILAASKSATFICYEPVLANGRLELLHYLREVSLSYVYHRYGYLGPRESELRKPVL